jgi:hypothetical protein
MNEAQIQRAVLDHLRIRGVPDLFFLHIPNGGLRLRSEAARLKGLGTRAGAPDLLLVHEGRVYGLELKAPGGRVTAAQLETLSAMEAAGACTGVAEGLDQALAVLEQWRLLRGAVTC